VNKQTIALVVVAVVAAIAAVLVLLPSEGPVTVPKATAQGNATVSPSGAEIGTADIGTADGRVPAAPVVEYGGPRLKRSGPTETDPNRPPLTAGIVPTPGIPLDVHGQKDSHVWVGIYRMMLRDNGGPTELADRVHEMGTTVAGVTSANDLASYAPLFSEERKLIGEVRAASSNPQILANCDQLEAAITAIESGHLHPSDKEFETADAAAGVP
jgi:hypothetical protein